jgi:hypothetical protein
MNTRKKFFALFLPTLLLTFYTVNAQTPTFNRIPVISDSLHDQGYISILDVGDGVIAAGCDFQDPGLLYIAKFDPFGNRLWQKTYGSDSVLCSFTSFAGRILIRTSDNNLMLVPSIRKGTEWFKVCLMKLTTSGDTIWTRTINDPQHASLNNFATGIIETADHGFAIIGGPYTEGVLYRTDNLGNLTWRAIQNYSAYNRMSSVIELPDHGFLTGAFGVNQDNYSGNNQIARYNAAGTEIWNRQTGSTYPDDIVLMTLLPDSNYLCFSSYTIAGSVQGYPEKQMLWIYKFSRAGDILWQKFYGDTTQSYVTYSPSSLARMPDGTLMATGDCGWNFKAWLFNFNENGDSLFFRVIPLPDSLENSTSQLKQKVIYSLTVTSDNGVMVSGQDSQVGSAQTSLVYYPWLFKTDRYGCMTQGCDPMGIYLTEQPSDIYMCPNDTMSTSLLAVGDSLHYQWQGYFEDAWVNLPESETITGTQSSLLTINGPITTLGISVIRCIVSNSKYTVISNPASFHVGNWILIEDQTKDLLIHRHDTAAFFVICHVGEAIFYQWYLNDNPIQGAIQNTYDISSVESSDVGVYLCFVKTLCDSVWSDPIRLRIIPDAIDELHEDVFQVIPDPASTEMSVILGENVSLPSDLLISDLSGHEVTMIRISQRESKINVSGFSPGVYIFRITNNKQSYIGKVMIIR